MSDTKKPTVKMVEKAVEPYSDAIGRFRAGGLSRADLEVEMRKFDEAKYGEQLDLNSSVIHGARLDADEAVIVHVRRNAEGDVISTHQIIRLSADSDDHDAAQVRAFTTDSMADSYGKVVSGMDVLLAKYQDVIDDRLADRISTDELIAQIQSINPRIEGDLAHVCTVGISLPDGKRLVVDGFYNRSMDAVANAVVIG